MKTVDTRFELESLDTVERERERERERATF